MQCRWIILVCLLCSGQQSTASEPPDVTNSSHTTDDQTTTGEANSNTSALTTSTLAPTNNTTASVSVATSSPLSSPDDSDTTTTPGGTTSEVTSTAAVTTEVETTESTDGNTTEASTTADASFWVLQLTFRTALTCDEISSMNGTMRSELHSSIKHWISSSSDLRQDQLTVQSVLCGSMVVLVKVSGSENDDVLEDLATSESSISWMGESLEIHQVVVYQEPEEDEDDGVWNTRAVVVLTLVILGMLMVMAAAIMVAFWYQMSLPTRSDAYQPGSQTEQPPTLDSLDNVTETSLASNWAPAEIHPPAADHRDVHPEVPAHNGVNGDAAKSTDLD